MRVCHVSKLRKFIKNCSIIAGPLFELLKNKVNYKWDSRHEEAFIKVKEELKNSLGVAQPDFNKPFKIETNASNIGIAGILTQEYEGIDRPIAFASRKLAEHELKYSISEKECLAILWAMEHYKYFLYGTEFIVITDHKAL